ncbi:TonB-dependent receptor [Ectothiorhodospira haloalkaliphila]|uniref:TonB-dependent receptor n=1 Tax=Ectothiorhodospira haloalkaliphila TaxID=421628 RepID=W8L693_9GAMM|nr:TonB-dependent receptor [Ectothiorhodospira haloalkaliphila]AHK79395.1 TonB-dependent receptor [Ectothiorhodospira haloalkaliphila]
MRLRALTALITTSALPVTLLAETSVTLPPMTVTAKGYEAAITETAAAVNVIEGDAVRWRQARTLGDVLRGEPGLSVAVDGSVGVDPIIRGLKRDQVLVLVDGVRINAMQPPARGSLASYVNMDLVERIEVIRGPSSVLYGAGAMGGVINIITRGGGMSAEPETRGWTSLGYSSVDTGIRGSLGASVSGPRSVLDVSAAYLDTDDYRTGEGERLRDSGTEQQAVHLRYRVRVTDGHELQFRAQRDRREDVWYLASRRFLEEAFEPPAGQGLPQPQGLNTHYTPRQTRDLLELSYDADLGGAWGNQLSASVYRQELTRGNYDWNRERRTDYRTSDTDFTTDGVRIQWESSPLPRHVLLVGAEAWRLQASPVSYIGFPPDYDPVNEFQLIDQGRLESRGLFIQDDIHLDNVTISLGARYDEVQGRARDALGVPGPLDSTDYNLSWSTGITWYVDDAFTPYASLSEGYRSAGLLERYLTYAYSDGFTWLSNPQLDPERNRTLEIGARGELGNTRYTLAVYESRIKDHIGGQVVSPGLKQTVNLDEARIRGAEFSLEHDLTDRLTALASGTWLRGDNRDSRFDEPLYQMPPPELTLGLLSGAPRGWQWEARLRAVASQDRVAERFSNGSERETGGFTTADVRVGYRFGPGGGFREQALTLAVTNLADRNYREHVNEMTDERLASGPGVQELRAPGRSLGVTWVGEF